MPFRSAAGWQGWDGEVALGIEHTQGAGLFALAQGIDKDHNIVVVKQGRGEVESADTKIDCADVVRKRLLRQPPGDLTAKGIVSVQDVADSGDQDAAGG